MSDNSPYGSRLGVGGRHNQIKQQIYDGKKARALRMLGETDYFDDKKIVDIDKAEQNIEGPSSVENIEKQEVLPTYNAGAQTERNRQSQMNQMLQQH